MRILSRDPITHNGKTVQRIVTDDGTLTLCTQITIQFTDGSRIILQPDWRGDECYISEVAS